MNAATINGKPTYIFRVSSFRLETSKINSGKKLEEQFQESIREAIASGTKIVFQGNGRNSKKCACGDLFAIGNKRFQCFKCEDAADKKKYREKRTTTFACPYCKSVTIERTKNQETCFDVVCTRMHKRMKERNL